MGKRKGFSWVEVCAVLIKRDDKFLLGFNSEWGSFTLPMTKRRSWKGEDVPGFAEKEEWEHAAGRAASEFLDGTHTLPFEPNDDVPEWTQGDRDHEHKHYQFKVFTLNLPADVQVKADKKTTWLTMDEILDKRRWPISKTARHILRELFVSTNSAASASE